MITDSELIFWIVCGILAILFVIAIPFINNYLDYKEWKRREDRYDAIYEANKE